MHSIRELRSLSNLTATDAILELIERTDVYANMEFLLAQTTHVEVGSTPTLIFRNAGNKRILLEVFNTDPAQPVWISLGKTRRPAGLPIFPESSQKVAVPSGQNLYGVVEGGTVDVRFAEYNIPLP